MGGHMSSTNVTMAAEESDCEGRSKYKTALKAYKKARKGDSDVKNFDDMVQERTGRLLNIVVSGMAEHSLSLDSLKEIVIWLRDMDLEVLKLVKDYMKDIWKHKDVLELVTEYVNNSIHTSKFYGALKDSLGRAKDSQRLIQIALDHIPPNGSPLSGEQYKKVTEKLEEFKMAGNPFDEEISRLLKSICEGQEKILAKLVAKKNQLQRRVMGVRMGRSLLNILFALTIVTVVIAAAMGMFFMELAFPIMNALDSPRGWLACLCRKYQKEMKMQLEVIDAMLKTTTVRRNKLKEIDSMVEDLQKIINRIHDSIDSCSKDKDDLRILVEGIREKHQSFTKELGTVYTYVGECAESIRQSRNCVNDMIEPDQEEYF